MTERLSFIELSPDPALDYDRAVHVRFGISRKTGYKWLGRDWRGLLRGSERTSHSPSPVTALAPDSRSHAVGGPACIRVGDLGRSYPTWLGTTPSRVASGEQYRGLFRKPGCLGSSSGAAGLASGEPLRSTPVRRTRSGRPILQGHSAQETVCIAIHSRGRRLPRYLLGCSAQLSLRNRWRPSPLRAPVPRVWPGLGPFALIMARPLPRRPSAASRS